MIYYISAPTCTGTCSQSDIVSIKSEPSLPVGEKPPIPEQEDEGYGIPTHEARKRRLTYFIDGDDMLPVVDLDLPVTEIVVCMACPTKQGVCNNSSRLLSVRK